MRVSDDPLDNPRGRAALIVAYWPHAPRVAQHIGWGVRRAALRMMGFLLIFALGGDAALLALHRPALALAADALALAVALAAVGAQTGFYYLDHEGAPYAFVSRGMPATLRRRRPVLRRTFRRRARTSHASVTTRASHDTRRMGMPPATGRGRRAGLDAASTRRRGPHDAA